MLENDVGVMVPNVCANEAYLDTIYHALIAEMSDRRLGVPRGA
jgi:hypothetical protein